MNKFFAAFSTVLLFGCVESATESTTDPNNELLEELAPTIGIGPTNGQAGFCTVAAKCASGQGDCNSNTQCQTGLICVNDIGGNFGFGGAADVCLPSHCDNSEMDQDETGIDCGGSCGLCPECPTENGEADFCTITCPCVSGEGDCDKDAQCEPGLLCAANIGSFYGIGRDADVCVESHCGNKTLDFDETGVDCGGNDCGACVSHTTALGSTAYCSAAEPCNHGEGDCDSFGQCIPGAICVLNVGADFGFAAWVDVCVIPND